jgi:hypothetical protein
MQILAEKIGDQRREIRAVRGQWLGETVLIDDGAGLQGRQLTRLHAPTGDRLPASADPAAGKHTCSTTQIPSPGRVPVTAARLSGGRAHAEKRASASLGGIPVFVDPQMLSST